MSFLAQYVEKQEPDKTVFKRLETDTEVKKSPQIQPESRTIKIDGLRIIYDARVGRFRADRRQKDDRFPAQKRAAG
ncbi:MAG TPA: hypothetical protein DCY03_32150, partial [Planctomycetaceae bacterium]|nr:hypothetical protein [Planctomycetaceae bacterium]